MPQVKESIFINRVPEDVHTFLRSEHNALLWQSNLVEFELLDDEYRKGAHLRGMSRVAGRTLEWIVEIAELEFGHRSLMRTTEAQVPFVLEYLFAPQDGGTLFTWHMEVESLGGFFGKLADPLVVRMFTKSVKANLETLKELLEA